MFYCKYIKFSKKRKFLFISIYKMKSIFDYYWLLSLKAKYKDSLLAIGIFFRLLLIFYLSSVPDFNCIFFFYKSFIKPSRHVDSPNMEQKYGLYYIAYIPYLQVIKLQKWSKMTEKFLKREENTISMHILFVCIYKCALKFWAIWHVERHVMKCQMAKNVCAFVYLP